MCMHKIVEFQNPGTEPNRNKEGNIQIHVGDFNIPLLVIDRTCRQKISKNVEDPNNTINKLIIIGICRTLHPTTAENTFLSHAHELFTKINHWAIKKYQ